MTNLTPEQMADALRVCASRAYPRCNCCPFSGIGAKDCDKTMKLEAADIIMSLITRKDAG